MEAELEYDAGQDARKFEIAVRRLATSLSYGTDHSPFLGSGVEYVQSRPYQPGDPVRAIDWRVTARAGRVFVKEFESQKRMPCYLLIDTSASMTISSVAPSKYAVALFIAGGVALACLDRVSPVGVVGAGSRPLRVEPSLSKGQIMQWLLRLRRFRYDETTSLSQRIAELAPRLAHRVLVLVLSDLHDPGALPALKRLAQLHDCAVIQLEDPAEIDLRGAGFLRGREAETGRELSTHGRVRHLAPAEVDAALKRAGIDHLRLPTERPYAAAVRRFLQTRGILGRKER